MAFLSSQTRALLRMQWRIYRHFYSRNGVAMLVLSTAMTLAWLGMFVFFAVLAARYLAQPRPVETVRPILGYVFLGIFGYWQLMPLLVAGAGVLLDWSKMLAYPIPDGRVWRIELALRILLLPEMALLTVGIAAGLARNPSLPLWCAVAPLLFGGLNLAAGSGVRDLVTRWLTGKKIGEWLLLVVVLAAALPAFLAQRGVPDWLKQGALRVVELPFLPWSAAAAASLDRGAWLAWVTLAAWAALGSWFSWRQLRLSLRGEKASQSDQQAAKGQTATGKDRRWQGWATWPSRLFPDPLAAVIEKEIRSLARTSRFRTVFFMGFTFGLIVWLPLAMSGGSGRGWVAQNFLTVVSGYALLLLSEVCFYNIFGFDRAATQLYYLAPVRLSTALTAKNAAAVFFVVAQVTAVALACVVIRTPLTVSMVGESLTVSATLTLVLMGIGNLASTYAPRAMNPNNPWKQSGNMKIGLYVLLIYPLVSVPVVLAYLARYAFGREAAFYAAMSIAVVIAFCFYWVARDSAVSKLDADRERILGLLSQVDAPA